MELDDPPPPAYAPVDPFPSTSQNIPTRRYLPRAGFPPVPPTNFVNLSSTHSAIKGAYLLDPALLPPAGVPILKDSGGKPLHLRLGSTNGLIDAIVALMRAANVRRPLSLEASTTNGDISLHIEDEQQQHFRLRISSINGDIILRLPPTFIGPIFIKQINGPINISTAIQARLVTFYQGKNENIFFVGNYRESGYIDDESWLGDALRVDSHNGLVSIAYNDD